MIAIATSIFLNNLVSFCFITPKYDVQWTFNAEELKANISNNIDLQQKPLQIFPFVITQTKCALLIQQSSRNRRLPEKWIVFHNYDFIISTMKAKSPLIRIAASGRRRFLQLDQLIVKPWSWQLQNPHPMIRNVKTFHIWVAIPWVMSIEEILAPEQICSMKYKTKVNFITGHAFLGKFP